MNAAINSSRSPPFPHQVGMRMGGGRSPILNRRGLPRGGGAQLYTMQRRCVLAEHKAALKTPTFDSGTEFPGYSALEGTYPLADTE